MQKDQSIYDVAPKYCHHYFDLVMHPLLNDGLAASYQQTLDIYQRLDEQSAEYTYGPGKWTLKQIMRHLIDCERIYTYRALRLSKKDATELAGFDQNAYISVMESQPLNLSNMIEEYKHIRMATMLLFQSMDATVWDFQGRVNNGIFTPRAIGFMAVGHNIHHCNVILERYSKAFQ